jgi:hypothetical protein
LAWGLKALLIDIEVDIFFKEKPNIGEKIKIAESISSFICCKMSILDSTATNIRIGFFSFMSNISIAREKCHFGKI